MELVEAQETARQARPPAAEERLADLVAGARALLVVTGAGCSTESGIPDYRHPDGSWKHRRPMLYQELVASRAARRRYWARSFVGWERIAAARPNAGHLALARLEAAGRVAALVTQNVDGLHQKAGSRRVVDLHGRLDRVSCLGCRTGYRRDRFQAELERLNPGWRDRRGGLVRPDGDVEIGDDEVAGFRLPECPCCGADLKPAVVFFGEAIPHATRARAAAALAAADAVLVAGSSLMVGSGYRFAREAAAAGKPLGIVNLGRTRGDDLAAVKVEGRCGDVLARLADRLAPAEPSL
ncbi:MAG TPA: NAD-dependent protein deacetylase [Thermoanaerobaculia bacterium]|nr:NAD-dependent protein deacetylase [Thermoanaerobaculia bacterium]